MEATDVALDSYAAGVSRTLLGTSAPVTPKGNDLVETSPNTFAVRLDSKRLRRAAQSAIMYLDTSTLMPCILSLRRTDSPPSALGPRAGSLVSTTEESGHSAHIFLALNSTPPDIGILECP
jgi:hypothetical protein